MDGPKRMTCLEPAAEWLSSAPLPTRHGRFEAHIFCGVKASHYEPTRAPCEHVALVMGDLRGKPGVPVRVHSECMTSEVFGSMKCDCKEQLDAAMALIARGGLGAVLYLRQEGRGIGLANKIRAYAMQSLGYDTVDANRELGLPDDARRYDIACHMLAHFGVKSVRLLTNNPAKLEGLRALGVDVVGRIPLIVSANAHSATYLNTKRVRMAHALPLPGPY